MIQEVQFDTIGLNALEAVIWWFADPRRVAYHTLSRVVRASMTPICQLILGIALKRLMGLNKECRTKEYTQMMQLRRYINSMILSHELLHDAFSILGAHYEVVSVSFYVLIFQEWQLTPSTRLYTVRWERKSASAYTGQGLELFARIPNFLKLETM